ncbi:MAG: hypothetical protein WAT26_02550, partial [Saprospiraceae bacterium]
NQSQVSCKSRNIFIDGITKCPIKIPTNITADTPNETLLSLILPIKTPRPIVIKRATSDCVISGDIVG